MTRAVFLDRDGTVNEEVEYLSDLSQLRLIPGAAASIRKLNQAGFKVVLVTNQSGIARGYFPETFVHETHDLLRRMLAEEGAGLDAVYYCPHHPRAGASEYTRACDCRKPDTGMIDQAVRDLGIDVAASFVVGDKWSDVELGQRAGARSVLVRTGHAADDKALERPSHLSAPDLIAGSITEAVDWILEQRSVGKT
jgi:D-glycero-D-manno-heptose 1,7-bisphosphate phosphatase